MAKKHDERDFLDMCALRFDGYKYHDQQHGRFGPDGLNSPDLLDRMQKTGEFCPDVLDNLWAFFAMQRYLGKWGGEYLTEYSDEHLLFRLLFLHLYGEEIPAEYRDQVQGWYARWETEYEPIREELAAQVRKTLRRKGRGPKLGIDITDPRVQEIRRLNQSLQEESESKNEG